MAFDLSPELIFSAEEVYDKLKFSIEKSHFGEFIVIDPISKDYFISPKLAAAIREAKTKRPSSQFYSKRIGHKSVASFSFTHTHIKPL